MSNTDPVVPRLETSGPREPSRGDPPQTLGGAVATVMLLLGGLFAASVSLAVLAGLLLALAVGVVAGLAVSHRRTSRPVQFCLPRASACITLRVPVE